jgi:hypothetical protein
MFQRSASKASNSNVLHSNGNNNRSHQDHHYHHLQYHISKYARRLVVYVLLISLITLAIVPFCYHFQQPLKQQQHQQNVPSVASSLLSPTAAAITAAKTTNKDYAYAFVIGGCDVENPSYRGYLYNVLIAASILRHFHATEIADIVLYVQMSYHNHQHPLYSITTLPKNEEHWLQQLDVQIIYLPRTPDESFYRIVLNKFRILSLPYRRVLLLDADCIPTAKLDFLFHLSKDDDEYDNDDVLNVNMITNDTSSTKLYHRGTQQQQRPPFFLKENVVIQGKHEPANAGFFLLKPGLEKWKLIQQIVHRRESEGRMALSQSSSSSSSLSSSSSSSSSSSKKYEAFFDPIRGWGHVFSKSDSWRSLHQQHGYNWTFWAAHSDQGLLYYWVKYIQQSVSIVIPNSVKNLQNGVTTLPGYNVKNWGHVHINGSINAESSDGMWEEHVRQELVDFPATTTWHLQFEGTQRDLFREYLSAPNHALWDNMMFEHFTGKYKPWLLTKLPVGALDDHHKLDSPTHYWFHVLQQLNGALRMGINFTNWTTVGDPTYGFQAGQRAVARTIQKGLTPFLPFNHLKDIP